MERFIYVAKLTIYIYIEGGKQNDEEKKTINLLAHLFQYQSICAILTGICILLILFSFIAFTSKLEEDVPVADFKYNKIHVLQIKLEQIEQLVDDSVNISSLEILVSQVKCVAHEVITDDVVFNVVSKWCLSVKQNKMKNIVSKW